MVSDHQPFWTPAQMDRPGFENLLTEWDYWNGEKSFWDERQSDDMAEKYWVAGAKWHVVVEGCTDGKAWDPTPKIYNGIWDLSKTVTNFVLTAVFVGIFPETVAFFGGVMRNVIDSLQDSVFWPFFTSMVILGAIWMAWVGLVRKRFTLTVQGAVWMVLATALGLWMMAFPGSFFKITVDIANVGSGAATMAMSSAMSGETEYECLPGAVEDDAPGIAEADDPTVQTARLYQRSVWQTLVCEPWKRGAFGPSGSGQATADEYGKDIWIAQTTRLVDDDGEAKKEEWTELSEQVKEDNAGAYEVLSGNVPAVRTDTAMSALAASIILGGMLGIVAFAVAVLRVALMFLLMLSPIVFLFGIHPGWGQGLVRRYFETLGGMALKQGVLLTLMGVLLVAFRLVVSSPLPWRMHILLYLLILIIVLIGRKKAMRSLAEMMGGAQSAAGRMMKGAAEDRTLERASGFAAWNTSRKKVTEWGMKAAGVTMALAGAGMLPTGGGKKSPPTGQTGKDPAQAPPMGGRAWDSTPRGGRGLGGGTRSRPELGSSPGPGSGPGSGPSSPPPHGPGPSPSGGGDGGPDAGGVGGGGRSRPERLRPRVRISPPEAPSGDAPLRRPLATPAPRPRSAEDPVAAGRDAAAAPEPAWRPQQPDRLAQRAGMRATQDEVVRRRRRVRVVDEVQVDQEQQVLRGTVIRRPMRGGLSGPPVRDRRR